MYRVLYITQVHSCHMQIRKIISSVLVVFTICCKQTHGRCGRSCLEIPSGIAAQVRGSADGRRAPAGQGGQAAAQSQPALQTARLSRMGLRALICMQGGIKIRWPKWFPSPRPSPPSPDGSCPLAIAETTTQLMKQLLECSAFLLGLFCLQFRFNLMCFSSHSFTCLAEE